MGALCGKAGMDKVEPFFVTPFQGVLALFLLEMGLVAGRRVLASALLAGPGLAARTIVATPTAVAQALDEAAVLVTVLADDAAAAQRQRDELCACLLSTARA